MKNLFYLLFISVTLLLNTSSQLLKGDKRVLWENETQLTWKDFKSTPDDNSPFKALTSWGIGYNVSIENGKLTVNHECYFLPEKSWVKEGHKNDYLLNHERQHFNIAQIYARRFHDEIETYKSTITKLDQKIGKDISKIYELIMKECYEEQQKYDKETEHSIDKVMQAKWDKYIRESLEKSN